MVFNASVKTWKSVSTDVYRFLKCLKQQDKHFLFRFVHFTIVLWDKVHHVSTHSDCDWCCMCSDGPAQICLSLYMDHTYSGKHLKMLCPAFTHTSFSLHIGVYGTLWFASTNKKTTSCIIFALRGLSVLCFPTITQFKPLDFHHLLCRFLFLQPIPQPHISLLCLDLLLPQSRTLYHAA